MDHLSQPSRAVYAFCLFTNIPFQIKEVRIFQPFNEFRFSEQFQQISPLRQVPAIRDNDFCLVESHAIMQYLASTRPMQDHWYPKTDFKQRAIIDQYLHYHHGNIRTLLPLYQNFYPQRNIICPVDLDYIRQKQLEGIKLLNQYYLCNKRFIAGNKMSIADISAFCELMNLKFLNYDFSKFHNVQLWMNDIEKMPEMQEAHQVFYKILDNYKKKIIANGI